MEMTLHLFKQADAILNAAICYGLGKINYNTLEKVMSGEAIGMQEKPKEIVKDFAYYANQFKKDNNLIDSFEFVEQAFKQGKKENLFDLSNAKNIYDHWLSRFGDERTTQMFCRQHYMLSLILCRI